MSQIGKFLNLHPHMQSWAVYNENGPYTSDYKIGTLSPAQYGGLSYEILAEKGGDVYVIQTEAFGRCAIWAPRDDDSSITSTPVYANGGSSGGGSTGGTGNYLNLHPHMQSWAVYNEDGPYTSANAIGSLAPAQYGGLSYEILAEKGGDVYIIQTEAFGICAIWAPRDDDSSITSTPVYTNGSSSGGSTGGGETGGESGGTEIPGGLKVFIDPGHGGTDPGASGNGLQEKNIVLSIAKKLGVILNSYGISVKYSRETDDFVDLSPRAQMANDWGANLFVAIHANSAESSAATGTECYTHPNDNSNTKNLSANVARAIANKFGIPNRGHKEADFAVLRLTSMPSILVETAFISNSSDANLLNNRQDDFANTIANQILKYFNISESDIRDLLDYAGRVGLFQGYNISFTTLDIQIPIGIASLVPLVTMEGAVSLTEKLVGPYKSLNLSLGANTLTTTLVNDLMSAGINIAFERESLRQSIEKLTLATNVSDHLKYSIGLKIDGTISITLESSFAYEENKTVYQRLIINIKPLKPALDKVTITVPLKATNKIDVYDTFTTIMGTVALFAILGGLYYVSFPAAAGVTLLALYIGQNQS